MAFVAQHKDNQNERIFIYFCAEKNVSKAAMKRLVLWTTL